jgi:porphobilinogen synthase
MLTFLGNASSQIPSQISPNRADPLLRRMRRVEHLREFIVEQHISLHDLCHPVFIRNDITRSVPVENLPGVSYFPVDEAINEIKAVRDLGIKHFVVRPRPDKTLVDNPQAVMKFEAEVIEKIANACPDVTKIVDGYFGMVRSNGYYGVVNEDGSVNLEESLRELTEHAIVHGRAGADIVVSLGRLDNAVSSIRAGLDAVELHNVAILAYSINFGSSLAHAMLDGTDMSKNAYTQTIASKIGVGNINEAIRQTAIEIAQGADYIGVKPATIFLDAISRVKQEFMLPVATYIVSKEYCMVKAAAERGWINERDTVMEYMLSMKRAGADKIFSYWVRDLACWLKEGK